AGNGLAPFSGGRKMQKRSWFSYVAKRWAYIAGLPASFVVAFCFIFVWALTGPIFGFSDTWQLVINTSTTIITFLMVFLIQNAQNRDSAAVQLKLDELIRATKDAHNSLMDLEELESEELEKIRNKFEDMAEKARKKLRSSKNMESEFDIEKG